MNQGDELNHSTPYTVPMFLGVTFSPLGLILFLWWLWKELIGLRLHHFHLRAGNPMRG